MRTWKSFLGEAFLTLWICSALASPRQPRRRQVSPSISWHVHWPSRFDRGCCIFCSRTPPADFRCGRVFRAPGIFRANHCRLQRERRRRTCLVRSIRLGFSSYRSANCRDINLPSRAENWCRQLAAISFIPLSTPASRPLCTWVLPLCTWLIGKRCGPGVHASAFAFVRSCLGPLAWSVQQL